MGEKGNACGVLSRQPERKNHLEDVGLDRMMTLKMNLRK
jgi:hypothetical protein